MQDEKQEKLPLDAKLLSEAVIELNISRRSVGLYPPEHPIVREAIERAFQNLQKLFEIRTNITLGIVKDTLVIDENILDKRNPVFREFANILHAKGIAALTFVSGMTKEELLSFHELLTKKELPVGKELEEYAKNQDLRHIVLNPIDFSHFRFIEGIKKEDVTGKELLEDYIYGLMEGKLSESDEGTVLQIPPETMASYINHAMDEGSNERTYDRVITAYLKKKGETHLSKDSFNKFMSFVDNLRPELKRQFLSRSFNRIAEDIEEVEKIIGEMTSEGFQKIAEIFTKHSTLIPDTLKNLIDKLSLVKITGSSHFDGYYHTSAVIDDIEIGEDIIKLFDENNIKTYVSEEYLKELGKIVQSSLSSDVNFSRLKEESKDDVIDRVALDIINELLETDFITTEDYQHLSRRISELSNSFLETGRFGEILKSYNAICAHRSDEIISNGAENLIEDFFHTDDFIKKMIDAFRLWGRRDRENAARLANAFKPFLVNPLLDALSEESDASMRKFLLSILSSFGEDVIPHALSRLKDERWFVVRNMLYLLREGNAVGEVLQIRKLAKHNNINIRIEAVRTLLHFKTHDAVSLLKLYIQSEDMDLQREAVKLSGMYRIREAVPYLIRLVEKKDFFGTESFYKTDVVRALCEIGDRAAVESLVKIYNKKSMFYKENLEDLKIEIFKNLDKFPYEAINKLIELGLKSGNKQIKTISETLINKYKTATDKADIQDV